MRLRALTMLGAGVILATGAVIYTHKLIEAGRQPAGDLEAKVSEVVVASVDISFGHVIEPEMLRLQPWPESAIPTDAFTQLEDVLGAENVEPRRAKRPIATGEVLLQSKVSAFGEKVTIAHLIDPSKRAIAIRVNDVTGVAGFVTPGDRVDVVLTREVDRKLRADTILQDVLVRGVDQVADEDRDKPSVVRTVTVEVKPVEAQKLALAQQAGTLSLTLRNLGSEEQASLATTDVSDLGASQPKGAAQPASPKMRVNRGGESSWVSVPGS
jgi:pilus assembly protein CpaB